MVNKWRATIRYHNRNIGHVAGNTADEMRDRLNARVDEIEGMNTNNKKRRY